MSSPILRFFNEKQFLTVVRAVDIFVPINPTLTSEQIALRADEFLFSINPPSAPEIKKAIDTLEFPLPLLIFKFKSFSKLSISSRRRLLEKVVASRGSLRDLSRMLKLISTFCYYTHEQVRLTIGYVEFEDRPQFPGLDTSPHVYPPPT
jgi:hypothetical protein